jgi:excisionase family DNA binding protein
MSEDIEKLRADLAALTARVAALEKDQKQNARRLLSKSEAARRLGVDRNTTLKILIATKQLPVIRGGKRLLIPESAVERLVLEGYRLR